MTDEPGEPGDLDALASGRSGGAVRLRKSPSAFRTISEVADELHIPQHVLRFWETRFPQVKPLKRGGGRRYYRPDDIALLRSIAHLLYIQGYTIKGVQRLLREGGGALAEDIPPASEAERREDDVCDELDLHAPEPPAVAPALAHPGLAQPGFAHPDLADPDLAHPSVAIPAPPRDDATRTALRALLADLEALRALIPG